MAACSWCPQPAVIHQAYAGVQLCRNHFLRSFAKRAKLDLARQGRIQSGTVAVALSGGKDSVSVLHFLHALLSARRDVRLVAVTIDEGIAGYRASSLAICKELTQRLGIPWSVITTAELAGYSIDQYAAGSHGPSSEVHPNAPRPACGPCGVFRREGMNQLALAAGAAAIVTGHNLDDQAQTILMNHLKGDLDRAARLAPHRTKPTSAQQGAGPAADPPSGLVPRLMPFRTIPEKEVLLYAILNNLPLHDEAECPYAARSHRFAMRDVLVRLEEQTPGTRHALLRGQERLQPILQAALPPLVKGTCTACGQTTSGDGLCSGCMWRA